MNQPLKLAEFKCCVDADTRRQNIKINLSLGYPVCVPEPRHLRKIAIVGSGPSVKEYLPELIDFDGEVWAVNGAHDWLREQVVSCA